METIALLGQAMIGLVFLLGSVTDVLEYKNLQLLLQRKNLKYDEFLLPGAIGLKALGGLGLIFNVYAVFAAFCLAGFTIAANIIFHPFWKSPAADRKKEYFAFVVYLAVIGGLLVIVGR